MGDIEDPSSPLSSLNDIAINDLKDEVDRQQRTALFKSRLAGFVNKDGVVDAMSSPIDSSRRSLRSRTTKKADIHVHTKPQKALSTDGSLTKISIKQEETDNDSTVDSPTTRGTTSTSLPREKFKRSRSTSSSSHDSNRTLPLRKSKSAKASPRVKAEGKPKTSLTRHRKPLNWDDLPNFYDGVNYVDPVDNHLRDSITSDLPLLMIGVNPGITTARLGQPYALKSNRYWTTLRDQGITIRKHPSSEAGLVMERLGIGHTNMVSLATRCEADIPRWLYLEGAAEIQDKVRKFRPQAVAFVGKGLWNVWFEHATGRKLTADKNRAFEFGEQDPELWVGREVDERGQVVWEGARTFVCCTTSGAAAAFNDDVVRTAAWRGLSEWWEGVRDEWMKKEDLVEDLGLAIDQIEDEIQVKRKRGKEDDAAENRLEYMRTKLAGLKTETA